MDDKVSCTICSKSFTKRGMPRHMKMHQPIIDQLGRDVYGDEMLALKQRVAELIATNCLLDSKIQESAKAETDARATVTALRSSNSGLLTKLRIYEERSLELAKHNDWLKLHATRMDNRMNNLTSKLIELDKRDAEACLIMSELTDQFKASEARCDKFERVVSELECDLSKKARTITNANDEITKLKTTHVNEVADLKIANNKQREKIDETSSELVRVSTLLSKQQNAHQELTEQHRRLTRNMYAARQKGFSQMSITLASHDALVFYESKHRNIVDRLALEFVEQAVGLSRENIKPVLENVHNYNIETQQAVTSAGISITVSLKSGININVCADFDTILWKYLYVELDNAQVSPTECIICYDGQADIVFGCGHSTCKSCSSKLKECHICRAKISNRITKYA